jgi:hypothetical protein
MKQDKLEREVNHGLLFVVSKPVLFSALMLLCPMVAFVLFGNKYPQLIVAPVLAFIAYMVLRNVVLNAKNIFSLRVGYSIIIGLLTSGISVFIYMHSLVQLAVFLIVFVGYFLILHFEAVPTEPINMDEFKRRQG